MTMRTCALFASAILVASCADAVEGVVPGSGMDGSTQWAVAKFCHQLRRTNASIDLTLEFGEPAVSRITASTNTCAPPAGQPCVAVPIGRVPVRLLEGDRLLYRAFFRLGDQGEYGFEPAVTSTGQVVVLGSPLNRGTCMLDFLPDGGLLPDAGADGVVADGGVTDAVRADTAGVDAARDAGAGADTAPDAAAPDAAIDAAVDAVVDAADDVAAPVPDAPAADLATD